MLSDLNLTSSGCVLCTSICDPSSSQFPSACFYFILKLPHFGWNLPSWFSSHIIVQYHWPPFPHSYTQIKAASYFAHDVIDLLLPTGVGSCCPCIAHCFHLLRPFSSCSHPSSLLTFLFDDCKPRAAEFLTSQPSHTVLDQGTESMTSWNLYSSLQNTKAHFTYLHRIELQNRIMHRREFKEHVITHFKGMRRKAYECLWSNLC